MIANLENFLSANKMNLVIQQTTNIREIALKIETKFMKLGIDMDYSLSFYGHIKTYVRRQQTK